MNHGNGVFGPLGGIGADAAGQVVGGGLLGAQVNQSKRISELQEQGARLEKGIESISGMLRELSTRLDPVMRPDSPVPAPDNNSIRHAGPNSQHGQFLGQCTARIEEINRTLNNIVQRLAV